jgi:hypothetical protein
MSHKHLIKTGFRYTDENFEDWFKDSKTNDFLDRIANYIGWIIINLNELEKIIDLCIQELMSQSESGNELIAIFQSELTYSGKVNTLMTVYGWHIKNIFEGKQKEKWQSKLKTLADALNEAGEIRNQYAHAYWHDISTKRFVKTRTKARRDGVYHWFRKFSVKEMKTDLKKIEKAVKLLDKFDQELLYQLQRTTLIRT